METKVTVATEIALPVLDVVLSRLKTTDGKPVVVRCEVADEIVVWKSTERLPGGIGALMDEDEPQTDEQKVEAAERIKKIAPPMIEAATALRLEDGTWVRPAFYFGDTPPHPHSIPGRYLRVEDLSALVTGILRAGGYVGGAADALSFPVGDGEGRGDGGGTVDAGEGERTDPVGGGA